MINCFAPDCSQASVRWRSPDQTKYGPVGFVLEKSDPEPEYYLKKPDPEESGYEPDEYVEYELDGYEPIKYEPDEPDEPDEPGARQSREEPESPGNFTPGSLHSPPGEQQVTYTRVSPG